MHEVPGTQRPLLALDDEERLAGDDEEVLLVASQWYIAIGFARPESHLTLMPSWAKSWSPSRSQNAPRPVDVVPAGVAGVDDVPAVAGRDPPVLGLLELGLWDHEPSLVSGASDG